MPTSETSMIRPEERLHSSGKVKPKIAPAAAFYYAACVLPHIQADAAERGYAVAVHGTMGTDLDVVCVPWVYDAGPPDDLIAAIAKRFSMWGEDGRDGISGPTAKPHGRLSWAVIIGGRFMLDVSILPRGGRHEEVRQVR